MLFPLFSFFSSFFFPFSSVYSSTALGKIIVLLHQMSAVGSKYGASASKVRGV